ncbi:MAG: sugar ABC transporter permease [Dictyoglomus sp. NZ13-RE01]|nr:MAG: sugar ABC transporter permease [Dictyoglomus sp. NZ13-RE01]
MRVGSFLKDLLWNILSPAISIILALILGGFVILALGFNPLKIYPEVIGFALGNPVGWGYVLFNATSLILAGLAVAVAFKGGLFNIGVEGQILVGGMLSAVVGLYLPKMPWFIHLPIVLLFAAIGGMIWAFIPGILRAKLGVHEVINTIMMNWIAYALTNYLVINVVRETGVRYPLPQTSELPPSATLPRLGVLFQSIGINIPESNPLNASLLISILMLILVYLLLWRTRLGYEIRAIGSNPLAAENGGIVISRTILLTMLLSGAIAGLTSINDVLGYRHRFLDNFTHGIGFTGIAVALLGKNHPVGIFFSALLFGALDRMAIGMDVFTHIPREIISILQAIIIITVAVGNEVLSRFIKRRRKK